MSLADDAVAAADEDEVVARERTFFADEMDDEEDGDGEDLFGDGFEAYYVSIID